MTYRRKVSAGYTGLRVDAGIASKVGPATHYLWRRSAVRHQAYRSESADRGHAGTPMQQWADLIDAEATKVCADQGERQEASGPSI